jgi:hypothetical protein
MGRMTAAVGRERGGDFTDSHAQQAGLDDHLTREFHAGRANVHAVVTVFAERAYTAVEVAAGGVEEASSDGSEDRIAEIAMQRRHGPVANTAEESVAHHQVRTLP